MTSTATRRPAWMDRAIALEADGLSRTAIAKVTGVSAQHTCVMMRRWVGPAPKDKNREARTIGRSETWPGGRPRGAHQLGSDPFADLTPAEREVIARAAPEAAMWAIAMARGVPL